MKPKKSQPRCKKRRIQKMEIEGVIQHSIAACIVKQLSLKDELSRCEQEIEKWKQIQQIHANEEIKNELNQVESVRYLISQPKYTLLFLPSEPEGPILFKGFALDTIQFYIDLKAYCEKT